MANETIAAVTVYFRQAIAGLNVMALVQLVVDDHSEIRGGASYKELHRYFDGDRYVIGQVSRTPYNNIKVVESLKNPFICTDRAYGSLVVLNTNWPEPVSYMRYGDDIVIDAVKEFAEDLNKAARDAIQISDFPHYTRKVQMSHAS